MTDKLALTGSGRYVVSVNGVDLPGAHNFEREAIQRAANIELTDPTDVVEYRNDLRVRVEVSGAAPAPAPVPVPAPVPSANLLWQWDAKSVAPFGVHARTPHSDRVFLVTAGGRPAVRLLTLPGDNNVNGSDTWERTDLRLSNELSDGAPGRMHKLKHSFWLPDDYVQPPMSPLNAQPWHAGLVFDYHNSGDKGGQASFQVAIYPATGASADRKTGIWLELHAGTIFIGSGSGPAASTVVKVPVQEGAVTKNKWYDCEYDVRWAADDTGFFKAWVNGVLYMDHKGPTLYTGEGVYIKAANYHSAFGEPCAVLQGRMEMTRLT